MAEGERFELSVGGSPTAVFKTAALGHYASPPTIGGPIYGGIDTSRSIANLTVPLLSTNLAVTLGHTLTTVVAHQMWEHVLSSYRANGLR